MMFLSFIASLVALRTHSASDAVTVKGVFTGLTGQVLMKLLALLARRLPSLNNVKLLIFGGKFYATEILWFDW